MTCVFLLIVASQNEPILEKREGENRGSKNKKKRTTWQGKKAIRARGGRNPFSCNTLPGSWGESGNLGSTNEGKRRAERQKKRIGGGERSRVYVPDSVKSPGESSERRGRHRLNKGGGGLPRGKSKKASQSKQTTNDNRDRMDEDEGSVAVTSSRTAKTRSLKMFRRVFHYQRQNNTI